MKKILIIFGICILLVGMPATMAISSWKNEALLTTDGPPEWATNQFVGFVGKTNSVGEPQQPSGYIIGYCQDNFKDKFAGIIANNDEEEPEPVGYLAGNIIGPFMLGIIGDISNEKSTLIVGLGGRNETHFYFRLIAIVGPTSYMVGKYLPM